MPEKRWKFETHFFVFVPALAADKRRVFSNSSSEFNHQLRARIHPLNMPNLHHLAGPNQDLTLDHQTLNRNTMGDQFLSRKTSGCTCMRLGTNEQTHIPSHLWSEVVLWWRLTIFIPALRGGNAPLHNRAPILAHDNQFNMSASCWKWSQVRIVVDHCSNLSWCHGTKAHVRQQVPNIEWCLQPNTADQNSTLERTASSPIFYGGVRSFKSKRAWVLRVVLLLVSWRSQESYHSKWR